MTEKDIQKISEQYKDEKAPLYEKIHKRVEDMIVQQAKRRKRLKTFYKVFPVSLAMVLIICLAIILPIVLQPTGEQPNGGEIRYSAEDLDAVVIQHNLKEYAILHNEAFLYIDLYDIAEDLVTNRYFKIGDDSVTVYLQESFIHGDMGYPIMLTVMQKNISVVEFDEAFGEASEKNINDVIITFKINRQYAIAKFEYNGYKYYLNFEDTIDEEFLTEIINNMFSTNK